jgi:deoxyribodipyrimidine photo-lyase
MASPGSITSLCWFRSDLRIDDQPALVHALQHGPTVSLFIASPNQWRQHDEAPAKVDFRLRALRALSAGLEPLNVPLDFLVVEQWADVPQALLAYCRHLGITQVHCNREPGVNERRRDRACYQLLQQHGIEMVGHDGDTLLRPGTVKTGNNDYYRVFTPFAKRCRELLRTAARTPLAAPAPQTPVKGFNATPLPDELPGWPAPSAALRELWPAAEADAHDRLHHFIENGLATYQTQRDFPAKISGTSSLSPYLACGQLSALQCLHAALQANQGEFDTGVKGATTWITEILWREFYRHLLHGYPALSMHQPMKPETARVAWRHAPDDLQAWKDGRTGIPIVDAGMRQLAATGWMHNRVRMICAMFLSKNLLIDWRLGEAWFMQNLIDGDLASNNGGWQWSASTGADAAPYFRIFNPVSQSEKFDPQGRYIRRWVPELADLSDKQIHDPEPVARRQMKYPDPIVDLRSSRQRAIDAFAAL